MAIRSQKSIKQKYFIFQANQKNYSSLNNFSNKPSKTIWSHKNSSLPLLLFLRLKFPFKLVIFSNKSNPFPVSCLSHVRYKNFSPSCKQKMSRPWQSNNNQILILSCLRRLSRTQLIPKSTYFKWMCTSSCSGTQIYTFQGQ